MRRPTPLEPLQAVRGRQAARIRVRTCVIFGLHGSGALDVQRAVEFERALGYRFGGTKQGALGALSGGGVAGFDGSAAI